MLDGISQVHQSILVNRQHEASASAQPFACPANKKLSRGVTSMPIHPKRRFVGLHDRPLIVPGRRGGTPPREQARHMSNIESDVLTAYYQRSTAATLRCISIAH